MSVCCLPNCTSGYKTNFDKVHLFSVPSNKERREKWLEKIQKVFPNFAFKKKSAICHKHFLPNDVLTSKAISGAISVSKQYIYNQIAIIFRRKV